jgi:long-chain acyl-CoA synthetase
MKYKNIADMFFQKKKDFPNKAAYQYKKDGRWLSLTFTESVDMAEKLAAGFASLGIKKGDRIAIMSHNRYEWAITDYAAQALGAILVPIYPSVQPDQVEYIINDSESALVVVEDGFQQDKVDVIRKSLKTAQHFIIIDSDSDEPENGWKTFADTVKLGEDFLKENPNYIQDSIDKVNIDDWATIIYTSGTTGEPKGAILTHKNFISNVENSTKYLKVTSKDVMLSFLPLSHVLERMAGHYISCYYGATVAYAESIDKVAENMGEVNPTLMVSVPRLYEKIYARVLEGVESGSPIKQKIFYWALGVGEEYIDKIMYHKPIPGGLQIKKNIADKLVFSKLAKRVGGKIRFFISGGAPLSKEIAEFFGAAGLIILEGYGLTETSPVISINLLDKFKFGTVGPIIPNVEVKIAEDGEILTRGDHVMVGYYKKEAETKEAIDEEGWFHTGDIGIIDEDGFLKITDRKKNIIVTSGGKNIAPARIENSLTNSPVIEQAMVVGDKRKFCTAVIVAFEEYLVKWAEENKISYEDYEDLVSKPEVKELVQQEVDKMTKHLASYETIKKFVLARAPFTIETGELTPSLKVKRRVILEKYAGEIEKMYDV